MTKDIDKAFELQREACDAGVARGCSNLGVAYEHAQGVERDVERSTALYRRACEGGLPVGCSNLAAALRAGRGAPKNTAKAKELLDAACEAAPEMCGGWLCTTPRVLRCPKIWGGLRRSTASRAMTRGATGATRAAGVWLGCT